MARTILSGLQTAAYEHPWDRKALDGLKGAPGLETVIRGLNEHGLDRLIRIQYTGSNLRVTRDNLPDLHTLVLEAVQVLDMKVPPEVYLQEGGGINAFSAGVEKPLLVLNAGCLDHLTDDELVFVIGHELGHIKSQHVLYHQIGFALPYLSTALGDLPGLSVLSTAMKVALLNWKRMSELTADRAGLLACQNRDAAIGAMVKIAGLPRKYHSKFNTEDFLAQAREFKGLDANLFDRFTKLISIMGEDHPWTVMRAAEFERWSSSGQYDRILAARARQAGDQPANFCPRCGCRLPIGDECFCPCCGDPIKVLSA
ncbi:MAG TPA: M48 family metallopeptidase [Thermoanaerobaculia bacterium]|nr:M48 family metallopeptidase [Thermoanaerobaculia bacterium]